MEGWADCAGWHFPFIRRRCFRAFMGPALAKIEINGTRRRRGHCNCRTGVFVS
jgi:hypothetical protein